MVRDTIRVVKSEKWAWRCGQGLDHQDRTSSRQALFSEQWETTEECYAEKEYNQIFFLSEQTSFLEQFCAKPLQSWPTLCDPWTVAHQGPLSLGLPRQEYWSGLPWPSPGRLPHPGIKPASHASVLASGFFTTSTTWEPNQTKVIKSNQNLTNQKVTFKVNGKRPQMWPPSPTRPVTLVRSALYTEFPFTERTLQIGAPQMELKLPKLEP